MTVVGCGMPVAGNEVVHDRTALPKLPTTSNVIEGVSMMKKMLGMLVVLSLPLSASATQYRIVDQPREECWNEQVPVQARSGDYGAALIGGVAGGLLGSNVGKGNGRTAATALGAVAGAVIGDRGWGQGQSVQTVRRCRTVVDQVRVPNYERSPGYGYQHGSQATPQFVYREVAHEDNRRHRQWQRDQRQREQWEREQRRQERDQAARWRQGHRDHHDDDDDEDDDDSEVVSRYHFRR